MVFIFTYEMAQCNDKNRGRNNKTRIFLAGKENSGNHLHVGK